MWKTKITNCITEIVIIEIFLPWIPKEKESILIAHDDIGEVRQYEVKEVLYDTEKLTVKLSVIDIYT